MTRKVWYVVGDKFKKFSLNPCIISTSELENIIMNLTQNFCSFVDIKLGQGNDLERIKKLLDYIKENNLSKFYNIYYDESYQKASQLVTHKKYNENILIADPFQIDNDNYACRLLVDDRCSDMHDHVTGQHMQAMVLIEAARQMVIAVTEKFFIEKDKQSKLYFLAKKLHINFDKFLFPLSILMQYKINRIRGLGDNRSFDIRISFIQNEVTCVTVNFEFSMFAPKYIDAQEEEMALANILANA